MTFKCEMDVRGRRGPQSKIEKGNCHVLFVNNTVLFSFAKVLTISKLLLCSTQHTHKSDCKTLP